ncbi:ectoine/hydroxyectoine ABC transporter substrate-binding protein EhuB [Streptomyces boncukensis]|uniref:Ectoine/hydroxyectoine ABC transporter substrate-binding protein EhuB n=1 Tax=Streptomyces boncukensis TaxID=2711219 RepID=A0A6G4WV57_9ACTN|nr:ectoine/hydroxyectoine ABC transporter substrate-binding protein EhuB [Streptomyces boncukensis]NGO68883.1 ectoine/hydroxyectoine ABC transporter substrate-binding protein EhuB [Streptomyces boncukensis]
MAPPQRNATGSRGSGRGIRRRSLLASGAALGAVGALGMTGCSKVPESNLLARLKAQDTVRLGIAGEVPFGYIDKDGEFTGEAPEVAKVIFKRLGVDNVQPVATEFGSLIPGLNTQQFDCVSAGMYINAARCAQVIFADPEYRMQDAFIVAKGNPKGLHNYEDLVKKGAKLASGPAYAEIDYAIAAGYPKSKIAIYPDQVAGLNAVEAGRVDAFAGTALTTREVVKKSTKAEVTDTFQAVVDGEKVRDAGAFAFRKEDTELRDLFNRELHKMKKSGELLRIMRPFGFTENEMTDWTAKELGGRDKQGRWVCR